MMVSDMETRDDSRAYTPDTASELRRTSSQSPLRFKHSSIGGSSYGPDYGKQLHQGSSTIIGARGKKTRPQGERFSYALGDGKYLLLEEIDELDPRQKFGGSVMVKARDLSRGNSDGYLAIDHPDQEENDDNMKTMRTVELMSTPYGRDSKLSLKSTYKPGASTL